jgi:hypothetical protein
MIFLSIQTTQSMCLSQALVALLCGREEVLHQRALSREIGQVHIVSSLQQQMILGWQQSFCVFFKNFIFIF